MDRLFLPHRELHRIETRRRAHEMRGIERPSERIEIVQIIEVARVSESE